MNRYERERARLYREAGHTVALLRANASAQQTFGIPKARKKARERP